MARTISGDDKYAKDGFYIGVKGSDEIVEQVGKLIIKEYKSVVSNVESYVNNAVWDIKQYANELRLYEFIADWNKKYWMIYKNPEEQKHKEINKTMIERSNQIYNTILYQYQGTDCQFNQNIKNLDANDADKNHWDLERQDRIYKNGSNAEVIRYLNEDQKRSSILNNNFTIINSGSGKVRTEILHDNKDKLSLSMIYEELCCLMFHSKCTANVCDKLEKRIVSSYNRYKSEGLTKLKEEIRQKILYYRPDIFLRYDRLHELCNDSAAPADNKSDKNDKDVKDTRIPLSLFTQIVDEFGKIRYEMGMHDEKDKYPHGYIDAKYRKNDGTLVEEKIEMPLFNGKLVKNYFYENDCVFLLPGQKYSENIETSSISTQTEEISSPSEKEIKAEARKKGEAVLRMKRTKRENVLITGGKGYKVNETFLGIESITQTRSASPSDKNRNGGNHTNGDY